MRKYIRNIILFFVAIAIIDIAFGFTCRYLNSHAKGGDTKTHYDIAMNMKADVLLFGSSRCIHHYVPSILEDSLGMSVYNCGLDGNGILYQYSRLRMILNRYIPKVIVYDIFTSFDIEEGDNTKYLGWQKRYYDIPGVSEVFDEINPFEKYKLCSQLYRYNGSFVQMLSDNIHPIQEADGAGYKPVRYTMDYEPEQNDNVPTAIPWDPLKKKYFEKFYQLCKENGIVFIAAYSPLYKAKNSLGYTAITDFCHQNDIPLLDNYNNPIFSENRDYFGDVSHLNDTGALKYTNYIAPDIKRAIDLIK